MIDNVLLEARVEKGRLRRRTVLLEGLFHFFLPVGVEFCPCPVIPAQPLAQPAAPASASKIERQAARGWARRHGMAEGHAGMWARRHVNTRGGATRRWGARGVHALEKPRHPLLHRPPVRDVSSVALTGRDVFACVVFFCVYP